ncbi:TetR/AcrR family transcriptional regulator [uncultured Maritalea sp.]|jgi:TetR/AcrR family transcriptional repressor of uid operon|uniref:TetR/AcrR family transcriptional regulator n=1 Tax=uncultured Maritalea sp. TaxID=757249 RepID=UPI002611DA18|nr:TetR/AcrR family transcriptional regulator [uncultured Maritalea sp.]
MARTKNEELHKTRKKQILAAAKKCFIAKGIHNASMAHICKTGKISPGALYRYFPSKQAIIEAIAAQEHEQNLELIDFLRPLKNPVRGLKNALPDVLDTLLDKDFARLMIEISSEATRNPEVNSAFQTVEEQFKTDLSAIFQTAQERGTLVKTANIEGAIFCLLALFDGITARAASAATPSKKELTNALCKTIDALFA